MLGELVFEDGTDPRDALRAYLTDLIEFLRLVANRDERVWRPPFQPVLIAPMRSAIGALPRHADVVGAAIGNLSEEALVRHGLSGRELVFKFAVINDAYRAGTLGWSFLRWRRLIEALDVLLESILSATGAGTALSEIKDYIGLSVAPDATET